MADFLPRPDFYIASLGRSGSTMLGNWLSLPPRQLVFNEPFFTRPANSRLLRIQLANFGMPATDVEWQQPATSGPERFRSLMTERLRGRRWAFKEVLCEEHAKVLRDFDPPRIIITVRNVTDVALSFFEKHRLQDNLARFGDDWVVDYCVRETEGLLRLERHLLSSGRAYQVVRYEELTRSADVQRSVAAFVEWDSGGSVNAHLRDFDRDFEVERHGSEITSSIRTAQRRNLGPELQRLAREISERCIEFQRRFNYPA